MRKIFFLLLLMCGAAVASAQTDIYNRYSSRTDVRVASVTNFTLDTGITADVTLLEAIDDQGWQFLCREFSLVELSPQQMDQIRQGWDVTMFAQRLRSNPTQSVQVTEEQEGAEGTCYLGVSYLTQTIYIFCCTSNRQSDIILSYLIKKMQAAARRRN